MRDTDYDRQKGNFRYHFWLIFNYDGGMRMTRREPDVSRNERGMKLTATLPVALFSAPTLRADITVEAPPAGVPPIDTTAANEALKGALGVDIDLRIEPAGEP